MKFNLKCKTNFVIFLHLLSTFSSTSFGNVKAQEVFQDSMNSINLKSAKSSNNSNKLILDLLSSESAKNIPEMSCDFPFNEVDAMILSTVSYLPMCMVPCIDSSTPCRGITLKKWYEGLSSIINEKKDMTDLYLHDEDKHNTEFYIKNCNSENKYLERRLRLLKYLAECPRYKEITISDFSGNYVDIKEPEPKQFAAVTFTLNDGNKAVMYRGTDSTLAGWKEDVDLSWKEEIPSQNDAKDYLCKVSELYPNSLLYIGGHSKGGNLAVYASMKSSYESSKIRKSIINIFNFDGPGLRADIRSTLFNTYKKLKNKLLTFAPQSSVIGRIMNESHDDNFKCINSFSSGISQHDTFSWEVNEFYFKKSAEKFNISELAPESDMIEETVQYILKLADKSSLKEFSDSLFELLQENNISFENKENIINILKRLSYKYAAQFKDIFELIYSIKDDDFSELNGFKKTICIIVKSLTAAYWNKYELVNRSLNISQEITLTLDELKNSNFSFENWIKVVATIIGKIFNINSLANLLWDLLK